jgi:hypothetical protein
VIIAPKAPHVLPSPRVPKAAISLAVPVAVAEMKLATVGLNRNVCWGLLEDEGEVGGPGGFIAQRLPRDRIDSSVYLAQSHKLCSDWKVAVVVVREGVEGNLSQCGVELGGELFESVDALEPSQERTRVSDGLGLIRHNRRCPPLPPGGI